MRCSDCRQVAEADAALSSCTQRGSPLCPLMCTYLASTCTTHVLLSTCRTLLQPGEAAQEALFPYFAQWVLETYTDDIKAYRCAGWAGPAQRSPAEPRHACRRAG